MIQLRPFQICPIGLLGLALLAAAPARVFAQAPAAPPATEPSRAPLDPAVEKILDRLEAKGKEIRDIECNLVYLKEDPIFEGSERFEGVLLFKEDKPNPLFHIRFDRSVQNDRPAEKKEWHVFDGRWYIEAREKTHTIIKHEILRPGEKRELFRLGQGPFPLPFGQRKADILQSFKVRLLPPAAKDPPNSDHLECAPLPGTTIAEKYDTIHFWIDRNLAMPVRVQTVEKADGNKITASFSKPKLNTGLPGSRLGMPELAGYGITEDRLPQEDKPVTGAR